MMLFKLAIVEISTESVFLQQKFIGPLLDDISIFQKQNQVSILNGGQSVGNDKTHAMFGQQIHRSLRNKFRARIYRKGGFI